MDHGRSMSFLTLPMLRQKMVPHNLSIVSQLSFSNDGDILLNNNVLVYLPEPLLRIELEETSCWTCDWANSELVAIGTTSGNSILLHDCILDS